MRGNTKARTVEVQAVLDEPIIPAAPAHVAKHALDEGGVDKQDQMLEAIVAAIEELKAELEAGSSDVDKVEVHLAANIKNLEAMIAQAGTAHKRFGWMRAKLEQARKAAERAAAAKAKPAKAAKA